MRATFLAIVLGTTIPVALPAMAIAQTASMAKVPPEAEGQADQFLMLLKNGKAEEAVTTVIASSSLWSNRTGVKEQMLAQVDAANKIYGPVSAYEKVSTEWVGTMLIRQYYLVQHKNMVTRWEFDFTKTTDGWKVGYFGFTDNVQSLFP